MLIKPGTLSYLFFSCSIICLFTFRNYPVVSIETQTTENKTLESTSIAEAKSECPAADGYAVICISNCLGRQVTYSIRWGNGAWQQHFLNAGNYMTHSNGYELSTEISFDSDFGSINQYRSYTLHHNDSHDTDCRNARQYHFDWTDSDGCFNIFEGTCGH